MTDTDTLVDCVDSLDTQPSTLILRFPNGETQRIPMPSGKTTLGAGAGCAVSISYPEVKPLHCVLFPSPTGWRVRRWASDTLLNGGLFTEAPIEIGDRLQLGPVGVEFAGEEPACEEFSDPEVSACETLEHSHAEPSEDLIAEQIIEEDEVADYLPVVCESHLERTRSSEVAEPLEPLAEQETPAEQASPTSQEIVAEHAARLEEVAHRLAEGFVGKDQLQSELDDLRQQLESIRHEQAHTEQLHIATREAVIELERQLNSWRETAANNQPTRPKGFGLARRIWPVGLRRRLVMHLPKPIPPAESALGDEFTPTESKEAQPSETAETPHPAGTIDSPQLDWLNQICDSPAETQELGESEHFNHSESENIEPSEEAFSEPVVEKEPFVAPESFLDRYQHLLREDGESPREPTAPTVLEKTAVEPVATLPDPIVEENPPAHAPDDDSIEGYMARLLQRMRGEPVPAEPATPKSTTAPAANATPSHSEPTSQMPIAPPVALVADIEEIKAGPAPERSHDMAALRKLSNESARKAISDAKIRHHREYALTKLTISALGIVCGLVVMRMAPSYTSPEFISGLVPLFAGALWGCYTIILLLKVIRDGSFDAEDYVPTNISADEL